MATRKLIFIAAAIQLLSALVFLGVNEFVDVGKFVAFRNVSMAHHEGGDVDAELSKSIRRLSAQYYYPSLVFGGVSVLTSLSIGIAAAVLRAR